MIAAAVQVFQQGVAVEVPQPFGAKARSEGSVIVLKPGQRGEMSLVESLLLHLLDFVGQTFIQRHDGRLFSGTGRKNNNRHATYPSA